MSTLQFVGNLLSHKEEGGGIRHPLVVICHVPFAVVLFCLYVLATDKTAGQTIYFAVLIGLYASSTAYHTWRPDRLLRFADQTMISWYVLVTPMPFIHTKWWAWPLFIGLATLTAANKWREWEPNYQTGSLIFLLIGVLSSGLMLFAGLPNVGATGWELAYVLAVVVSSIGLFLAKLAIYHYQMRWPRFLPGVWEAPECGHFVLAMAVSIYTSLVVAYPV